MSILNLRPHYMLGMQEKIINNHNTSNKNMESLLSTITVATSRLHDLSTVQNLNYVLGDTYF